MDYLRDMKDKEDLKVFIRSNTKYNRKSGQYEYISKDELNSSGDRVVIYTNDYMKVKRESLNEILESIKNTTFDIKQVIEYITDNYMIIELNELDDDSYHLEKSKDIAYFEELLPHKKQVENQDE